MLFHLSIFPLLHLPREGHSKIARDFSRGGMNPPYFPAPAGAAEIALNHSAVPGGKKNLVPKPDRKRGGLLSYAPAGAEVNQTLHAFMKCST